MAINFPDSPTNGQVATVGGKNYTYNSTKNTWTPTQVTEADLSSIGSTTVVATHDLLPASPSAGDMALVSSVNKMYVYFLSGWWLMSSLQNASPSGITGNAAIYDLAADGTPTTVTLSSSDPEGFPIVWSHSVISGSLGGTTVTNVNNVFTITPSTDAADAGTFTLRFAASDGQGGESGSQSQFTLDFVFTITNSNYTTLLATAVDTSDNNNITDASTNNYLITVNGDAHAGTFSPYRSGGYSTYFDGSGDYLTATGTAIGTGDFTLEAWIYTASFSNYRTIFTNRGSSNSTGNFVLGVDSAAQVYLYSNNFLITSSSTLSANTWHHVALVRNGTGSGSTVLYIDGSSVGSADVSNNFSDTAYDIGGDTVDSYHWNGYISDLRVNIGTAIYISAFTPPTERLTAITNTSLLTCHLPYIADGSTNSYSITLNGNVSTKPFSPYDYLEYSATDHGGSVYFDGTTDYLLINSPPTLGANDWTFETWYYASNSLTYNNLLSQGPGNNTVVSSFSISGTGEIWIQTYTTTNVVLYNTAAGTIKADTWNHIVLTHDYDGSNGGTYKIYVNGNQVGSVSYTSGYYWNSGGIAGTALGIGQYRYNTQANGECYFSDWKISSGITYSSNFTPPTIPLSSSGAELHIKGTDASIIDKSQGTNLKLFGNTTGSTTQAKFANTKSIYFGSPGVGLSTSPPALDGEFTIECWVYFNSFSGQFQSLFSQAQALGGPTEISTRNENNTMRVVFGGNTNQTVTADWTTSINTWYHLAVVRDSNNTVAIYVDGSALSNVLFATQTLTLFGHTTDLYIGQYDIYNSYPLDGYMQDVRITKGLARYTANFTPPTASLKG